jgi:ribonuclease-3
VNNLRIIFRTHSDIEASIVRGLLDTHGIHSLLSSDVPHSIFPLSVNGLGEVRVSVRDEDAAEAARIIEGHREEVGARVVRLRDEFEPLERKLGYKFRDRGLLEHALTHRSRAHEDVSGGVVDNESLEFLGDAVLGFVIADLLFREMPDSTEGQKSKIKAALVSAPALARLGEELELGQYLLLGRGEEKTGGRQKQALIADGYEALIAAIYLDGGIEPARDFITRRFRELVDEVHRTGRIGLSEDHKSALQEWLQSHDRPLPEYRITAERGPDHRKVFDIEVWCGSEPLARGEGRSKKEAEQRAARLALEHLRLNPKHRS